jgi:predicted phage terminase large subunit-like protein
VLIHIPDLRRAVQRRSFAAFVKNAWCYAEPRPLQWGWYLDVLCDTLQQVTTGSIQRLIINVPPGTGKSLIVSVLWPAWMWARDPALGILTSSYSDTLPIRDNGRFRRVIGSEWFWYTFWSATGTVVLDDSKRQVTNSAQGWRIATSVGGQGTGNHPDVIVLDDLLKAQDARSPVKVKAVNDYYRDVIPTRRARDPVEVNVMQRLNQADLTAFQLDIGGWEHLCLPMRYEPKSRYVCVCHKDGPDPRDLRTADGELLCPQLWPEEKVTAEENALGPFGTSGQLQQHPVPEGGGLFKLEHVRYVDRWPTGDDVVWYRGWDTASTEGGGDWTVGLLMAVQDEVIYYVDVVRLRGDPDAVDKAILDAAKGDAFYTTGRPWSDGHDDVSKHIRELHRQRYHIREEVDHKSIEKAHSKMLAGFDYAGVVVSTSKSHRAVYKSGSVRAQWGAGNIRMVRAVWNKPYLDVMTAFPVGLHDDDVDATSCAWNAYVEDTVVLKQGGVWGRKVSGGDVREEVKTW